jgi:hypothetical protein
MNRRLINHSAIVLSVAMVAAWPLSPAVADKGGTPHEHGVHPNFGLAAPSDGPFPSDRFTVADKRQNTCERINLPIPDCTTAPSACMEIKLLNELDGFNTRPRIAIPFNGDIYLRTVDSTTIFLVSLGDSMIDGVPGCLATPVAHGRDEGEKDDDGDETRPRPDAGWVVGIDQGVWDPNTKTLYVEAAETLEQHTRYAVFVTRGVKDSKGEPIETSKEFKKALGEDGDDERPVVDRAVAAYQKALRKAVKQARFFGIKRQDIAVASVFTTLSVTAAVEKIRAATMATPAPTQDQLRKTFNIANGGARAVFDDLSKISKITFHRDRILPPMPVDAVFMPAFLDAMRIIPGAIKTLAFGRIRTPNYLQADASMIPFATYSGSPTPLGTGDLYFELMLPSEDLNKIPQRRKPPGGWPVVIWGHANNESGLNGSQNRVAAVFASHGIATLSWNQIGFGFGPDSTVKVEQTDGTSLTFPFAGRTYDLNHPDSQPLTGPDGFYDGNSAQPEGGWGVRDPLGFRDTRILFDRDANRQGIADIAQLIRAIEVGMDVDGDGARDLDPEQVYYGGLSRGAVLGVLAAAVESRFKASAVSSPGGFIEFQNTPGRRGPVAGLMLQEHKPSLLNPPGTPVITRLRPQDSQAQLSDGPGVAVTAPFYNENMPERGQTPIVNCSLRSSTGATCSSSIPGALEIQDYFERLEWLNANNAAGAFMEYLKTKPINGPARPILIQVARGDKTTVNPTVAEAIHAGMLADRVTLFRWDLFPGRSPSLDPHTFLISTNIQVFGDSVQRLALQAQEQIATFYESDGANTIDPDGTAPLFETPAASIPTDFGFIIP